MFGGVVTGEEDLINILFREKYYSNVFGVKCLHFCAELDRDNLKFLCHIPHFSDCHLDSVATFVKFSRSLNKTE